MTELLREAEEHHGGDEAVAPPHPWSGGEAAYIIAREGGRTPEQAIAQATEPLGGGRA